MKKDYHETTRVVQVPLHEHGVHVRVVASERKEPPITKQLVARRSQEAHEHS